MDIKEIDPIDEVIIGLLQGKDLDEEIRKNLFSKEADEKEGEDEHKMLGN